MRWGRLGGSPLLLLYRLTLGAVAFFLRIGGEAGRLVARVSSARVAVMSGSVAMRRKRSAKVLGC